MHAVARRASSSRVHIHAAEHATDVADAIRIACLSLFGVRSQSWICIMFSEL